MNQSANNNWSAAAAASRIARATPEFSRGITLSELHACRFTSLTDLMPAEAETSESPGNSFNAEIVRILHLLLADEYRLYTITRDYHRNVTGPDYVSLRLLLQLQHEKTAAWVDALAERIREIRLAKRIAWEELRKSARRFAMAGLELPPTIMLQELLRIHNEMIAQLSSDCGFCYGDGGDASIADFLTDLREQHENAAWMLRSQLGTPAAAAPP